MGRRQEIAEAVTDVFVHFLLFSSTLVPFLADRKRKEKKKARHFRAEMAN